MLNNNSKNKIGDTDPFNKKKLAEEAKRDQGLIEKAQKQREKNELLLRVSNHKREVDRIKADLRTKENLIYGLARDIEALKREIQTITLEQNRSQSEVVSLDAQKKVVETNLSQDEIRLKRNLEEDEKLISEIQKLTREREAKKADFKKTEAEEAQAEKELVSLKTKPQGRSDLSLGKNLTDKRVFLGVVEREMERLKKDLTDKKTERDVLRAEAKKLTFEVVETSVDITQNKQAVSSAEAVSRQVSGLRSQVITLKKEVDVIVRQIDVLQIEKNKLDIKISDLEKEISTKEKKADEEIENKLFKIEKERAMSGNLKAREEHTEILLRNKELEINRLENTLASKIREYNNLIQEVKNLENKSKGDLLASESKSNSFLSKKEIDSFKNKLSALTKEIEELDQKIKNLQDEEGKMKTNTANLERIVATEKEKTEKESKKETDKVRENNTAQTNLKQKERYLGELIQKQEIITRDIDKIKTDLATKEREIQDLTIKASRL